MAKTFWIVSDSIGSGDEELGSLLMRNFLYSLARAEAKPARVLLSNGGVRLACEGSESLDDLRLLIESGVVVKACGTCLDVLGLKGLLAVGEIGDMAGLVGVLSGDADVVSVA
jgi:intracellular sulfur oxidation DsrE/DsrF family protein